MGKVINFKDHLKNKQNTVPDLLEIDSLLSATEKEIDLLSEDYREIYNRHFSDGEDLFIMLMAALTAADEIYELLLQEDNAKEETPTMPESFEEYMGLIFGGDITLELE